jgi:topoisomerase-4 subunit A
VTPIVAMGANGRAYNIKAQELPGGKGDGVPMSSLADTQGTAIVALLSSGPETTVLFGSSAGYALRAKLEALITRQRAGKAFVSIGEGDALVAAEAYDPATTKEVAALSAEGRLLVFPLEEVGELPNGGRGVQAIKLHDGEKMVGLTAVRDGGLKIAAIGRGDKRVTVEVAGKQLAHYRHGRARSGRVLEPKVKRAEGFE